MIRTRNFSVRPVRFVGVGGRCEYPKVRADERVISLGRRVSVLRVGDTRWRPARVVEAPFDSAGSITWLELLRP